MRCHIQFRRFQSQIELMSHHLMTIFSYDNHTKFCTLIENTYYVILSNVLGQWRVTEQIVDNHEIDDGVTDVTHLFEFKNCPSESFWVHCDDYVVSATTHQLQQDETDDESFTQASDIGDGVVIDFHNAAKDFEEWKPKTQGEKRFKDTVKAIEMRATRQLRR